MLLLSIECTVTVAHAAAEVTAQHTDVSRGAFHMREKICMGNRWCGIKSIN